GGKAAPGYQFAKLIIKLITSVADVINRDETLAGRLKVIFLPNFNVKSAQKSYPAADLFEQISPAGMEASGTGNKKFAMNGGLTIGTVDGANIEIREEVGQENFFLFGLTAPEVLKLKTEGYRPRAYYDADPDLKETLDQIDSGFFSPSEPGLFKPLVNALLEHDPFMLLVDYGPYIESQEKVSLAYRDQEKWSRMSILNVARIGYFSSDRAIKEYCEHIWHVLPVQVKILTSA